MTVTWMILGAAVLTRIPGRRALRRHVRRHRRSGSRAIGQQRKALARRFLPADSVPKAFALGMLRGWLPCGLVYTVLFTALLSGSAFNGAIVMAFGVYGVAHAMSLGAQIKGGLLYIG